MSLIAHFPLNGDGINKGISNNFDIEDSNFDVRGKIGKYLKINNKTYSTIIPELVGKKQVSISFWFKEMAESVTQWKDFICLWSHFDNGEKVVDGEVRLEAFRHSTNNEDAVQWYSTVFNKNYPDTSTEATCFWEKHVFTENDVWYHNILLVDFENHTWTWYINGKKRSSYGINENALYFTRGIRLGDDSIQAGLNDLRIYDHILSEAEIKEIYKTPILKYNFDQPIMNPAISRHWNEDFSSLLTGETNKCAAIGSIIYNNNYVIEGDWVTISFDVEIQDLVAVEGQIGKVRIQEVTTLADGTEKWSTLIRDDEELNDKYQTFISSDGTREINLTNNGKYHIVRSYHFYDTARFINNWTAQLRVDYIQSGTLKITNYKVVLGKEEIPYDGTDGIVYDESGMGNDAIFIGENSFLVTSYSTDSKIGEGCWVSKTQTNLGESTYGILECDSFSEVPELSISFWLYVPETDINMSNDGQVIIGYSPSSSNYGLFIRRHISTIGATIFHTYLGNAPFTRNKWNYIVITAQKVGNIKIYIDGKLKATGTIPSGVDWTNAKLTIGDLRNGRGLGLEGKLDDLRIYATILTENDVAQMYKERQKVDNSGSLYCKLLNENNEIRCIESDGNQYIDTEFVPNQDTTIEMGFVLNSIYDDTGSNKALYGVRENYLLDNYSMICGGGNTLYVGYDTNSVDTKVKITRGQYYIVRQEKNITTLNSQAISELTKKDFTCPANLTLFVASLADSIQGNISKMELYYCKIWDGDTLIRDFCPAISIETDHLGEVCLYDLVSDRYFYNAGTGSFIAGIENNKIKFDGNGRILCSTLNEGFNNTKIKKQGNIIETNKLYEN